MAHLLAIETRRSVREVAEAMRGAVIYSTCKTNFATDDLWERPCDECRQHFFESYA